MNRTPNSTFSIRSTHRFTDTNKEIPNAGNSDTMMPPSSSYSASTSATETESCRTKGSEQGMCIRTTTSSAEDYY